MSAVAKKITQISWEEIERSIPNIRQVNSGMTAAQRGLVTLANNVEIFVKIGIDKDTKKWAKKEVNTYGFLKQHLYPFVPKLLSQNDDKTGFALEALTINEGWDWSDKWTKERLVKTLEAMDALAAIIPEDAQKVGLDTKPVFEYDDCWQGLVKSDSSQKELLSKLRATGNGDVADTLDISISADRSSQFVFKNDSLVHNDVRGDNCAWNAERKLVKLVDWNWLSIGDRRIDVNALLVSVYGNGLDILMSQRARLDVGALNWLAGFWFNSAIKPARVGESDRLRQYQLQSGITTMRMINKLQSA